MKFMWKNKRLRIVKAVLYRKSDVGGITILDLKLYYRGRVTITACYWHQNGPVEKHVKNLQWRKYSLLNEWCWQNRKFICSKIKLKPYLSPCAKFNSKWMKDLGTSSETLHQTEENIASNLRHGD